MNIYLHSFKQIKPKYFLEQETLNEWILATHQRCSELMGTPEPINFKALKRFVVNSNQINKRYFDSVDMSQSYQNQEIYHLVKNSPLGKDIKDRMLFFSQRAQEVFDKMYFLDELPNHLIHVSCTGYTAPSAPQLFCSKREAQVKITHAYHMGCYAALPALRLAFALGATESIDIVHNELCSLHLQPQIHTPEQMVVQSLFADGHIKYSVTNEAPKKPCFIIKEIQEKLIPETSDMMTWIPSPYGMQMTLSAEVPKKLKDNIDLFLNELAAKSNIDYKELIKHSIFAIHPGGPKIIQSLQETLGLTTEQVKYSIKVLRERGNMSSATLPHVWEEILHGETNKRLVVSLAFGPGLTIFGAIFEFQP